MKRRILYLFLLTIFTLGCNGDIFFQETQNIPEGVWNYDRMVKFPFMMSDTTGKYDIHLEIDHDRTFGYQNVYIKIHTVFPDGDTTEQLVPLELSDGMGQWEGICKGSECKRLIPLLIGTTFKDAGEYEIIFEQFTREAALKGVNSLRLEIIGAE